MDRINDIVKHYEGNWYHPSEQQKKTAALLKKHGKSLIKELGRTPLPTEYGGVTYIVFGDYTTGGEHDAVVFGDPGRKKKTVPLVRIHSSCRTSELFHAVNCECRQELELAMKTMEKEKAGIIIYLDQEGAGNGTAAKVAAYNNVFTWKKGRIASKKDIYRSYLDLGYPLENRNFEAAAEILKYLGFTSVRLMTNNPKKISGLESQGITVIQREIHVKPLNRIMKRHLKAKQKLMKHTINKKDL